MQLYANEKAVSEVIGAVLVLTVIVAFLGFLQVYSVPVLNKEIETSHFNNIVDDLLDMKSILYAGAIYDLPVSTVFHTSLDYPGRTFLLNPSKPSVVFTSRYDKQVTITYDGTTERVNSCAFSIEEKYNFFNAPGLVMEHGMIIGDTGNAKYIIDKPLLKNNNMNLLLLRCDNTSLGTGSSVSFNIYPAGSNNITVNNATLSFNTDYPALWNEYLATIGANWTLAGNIVTINYPNHTKIRVIGAGISTPSNLVLLPVTTPVQDTMPPASVTNLINVTYLPLYINWTWADPTDADFDHVMVYIDGAFKGNVGRGVQYYNASYFRPNSTHTISTRTVDTSGNVNATWVNHTAGTSDLFTYVFGFLNITGTVANFTDARNASDGGASAVFAESLTGYTSDSHNYTYVTGNIAVNGTITNFANMQSNATGAYADLIEGVSIGGAEKNTSYYATYSETGQPNVVYAPDNSFSSVTSGRILGGNFGAGGSGAITKVVLKYYYSITEYDATDVPTAGYTLNAVKTTVKTDTGNVAYNYPNPTYILDITSARGTWTWADIQSIDIWLNVLKSGATQTRANVDSFEVNVTTANATYSMNITTNTANVPVNTNYYLEINYSRNANETGYNVYVYNGTAWNLKGSLASLAWSVANFTLGSTEVINRNVSVRYSDQTPAGTGQGSMFIDYQRIHGYMPGIPTYSLNVTTNTTSISDASNRQIFQLRYNVSGDSFILQIWNGSAWNNRTTLNDTSMSTRSIILQPDEMLPYGTLIGNVALVNTYYVIVRYIDLNASTTKGSMYLDYQRVYTI